MHGSFEVREDAARDICACGASVWGRGKQRASVCARCVRAWQITCECVCEVREGVANNVRASACEVREGVTNNMRVRVRCVRAWQTTCECVCEVREGAANNVRVHQRGEFLDSKPKGGGKPTHACFGKTLICVLLLLLFLGFPWVSKSVICVSGKHRCVFWKRKSAKHKSAKRKSAKHKSAKYKWRKLNTNCKTQISLNNTNQQNTNK